MTQDSPESDGELTPTERQMFDKLPEEFPVSPGFERRLVNNLAERQLIRRSIIVGRVGRWFALAAAAAGFVLIGFRLGSDSGTLAVDRATFAFLLYEDEQFQVETPVNYAERYAAYSRWVGTLSRSNQFVTGLDFEGGGVVVDADSSTIERIPFADEGFVGSMFLVTAGSYEEALELARGLPHLGYGGRVAIRRIVPVLEPGKVGAGG